MVQIREKNADTGEVSEYQLNVVLCSHFMDSFQFLQIAQASKEICRKYNVPILINDRIDIALAIGADGVHIGQTDMPVDVARRLLPENAIIGMTCNTIEHVRKAVQDGVDYVGLGPVWATQTKKVKGKKGKGEDAEDEQDLERILEDVCHRTLGRLANPDLTQCG